MPIINTFDGGLNKRFDPLYTRPNECVYCENIDTTKGNLAPVKDKDIVPELTSKYPFFFPYGVKRNSDLKAQYQEFAGDLYRSVPSQESSVAKASDEEILTFTTLGVPKPSGGTIDIELVELGEPDVVITFDYDDESTYSLVPGETYEFRLYDTINDISYAKEVEVPFRNDVFASITFTFLTADWDVYFNTENGFKLAGSGIQVVIGDYGYNTISGYGIFSVLKPSKYFTFTYPGCSYFYKSPSVVSERAFYAYDEVDDVDGKWRNTPITDSVIIDNYVYGINMFQLDGVSGFTIEMVRQRLDDESGVEVVGSFTDLGIYNPDFYNPPCNSEDEDSIRHKVFMVYDSTLNRIRVFFGELGILDKYIYVYDFDLSSSPPKFKPIADKYYLNIDFSASSFDQQIFIFYVESIPAFFRLKGQYLGYALESYPLTSNSITPSYLGILGNDIPSNITQVEFNGVDTLYIVSGVYDDNQGHGIEVGKSVVSSIADLENSTHVYTSLYTTYDIKPYSYIVDTNFTYTDGVKYNFMKSNTLTATSMVVITTDGLYEYVIADNLLIKSVDNKIGDLIPETYSVFKKLVVIDRVDDEVFISVPYRPIANDSNLGSPIGDIAVGKYSLEIQEDETETPIYGDLIQSNYSEFLLNGLYTYTFAYVDSSNVESGIFDAESSDILVEYSATKLTIGNDIINGIPAGGYLRVFRIGGNLAAFTKVADLQATDIISNVWIDNNADSEIYLNLGPENPIADVPPNYSAYITEHKGRLYVAANGEPTATANSGRTRLYFNEYGNIDSWPSDSYLQFNKNITGLASVASGLLVFHQGELKIVTGIDDATFQIRTVSKYEGCSSFDHMFNTGDLAYFVSKNVICVTNGSGVQRVSWNKLGDYNFGQIVASTYWNNMFVISNGSNLLIMDMRTGGTIFTPVNIPNITKLQEDSGILYATDKSTNITYSMFTSNDYMYIVYHTGQYSEGNASMLKSYEKIRVNFRGSGQARVYLDNKLVTSKFLTRSPLEEIGIPNRLDKGYKLSFQFEGNLKIHSVEYSVSPRVNTP